jgi:Spy/CpxP family protein refolding chaperone
MKKLAIVAMIGVTFFGTAVSALAFHEEAGRAVGEAVDQFRGLGSYLERHLGGITGPMSVDGPASSRAERPVISFIIQHKDELGVTPEQISRLEALRTAFSRESVRRDADIRIAEMDLTALLDKDPLDMAQVEAKVRELAQLRADLRIARIRTLEQGRAVLTAEQRTKLRTLLGTATRPTPRTAERAPQM